MQVYRNLEIAIETHQPEVLIEALGLCLSSQWERDKKTEADARLWAIDDSPTFVFVFSGDKSHPAAAAFIGAKRSGLLEVQNIVPKEMGQIPHEDYNWLAEQLANGFEMCKEKGFADIRVALGPTDESMADLVSPGVKKLLDTFSSCANKSTGSSHPCDEARWFKFIIGAHEEECRLHASDLEALLIEEYKWDEKHASKLAIEYESGRSLLAAYDTHIHR